KRPIGVVKLSCEQREQVRTRAIRGPPALAPVDIHPRILQTGSQVFCWRDPALLAIASAIAAALLTFALPLALSLAFSSGGHNAERDDEGVEQLHRAVFLKYERHH